MAFLEQTERPYRSVEQLPGLPYVCVRVPTGGGKTVLAAHAVGLAAGELLHAERCTALWLAPTKAIVQQTLNALKDPRHPYRLALHEAFGGRVSIMDLSESLYLQRGTLESDTVVLVSTLAALRVTDTEGRKVYESNGALQHHFTGLTANQLAMLERSEDGAGELAYSLANVLRLHRPVVIIDEAHNARTPLSFETLSRFSPSCIVEFTATPDQETNPSNVLTQVSAAELKADQMIKLPIYLATRRVWREAVQATIAKQRELERIAQEEEKATGEYLRPLVLFQAQSRSKLSETVTVDVLRECLLTDFRILVVRVGTQKELFEEQFRDAPWSLSECDSLLEESEYRPEASSTAQLAEVDVSRQGKIEYAFVREVQSQLSLFDYRGPESIGELAVWLDRQISHPDITQVEASVFLQRMIEALIVKRRIPLAKLVASRFGLRDAAAEKINQHRRKALEQSFQHMLFPESESPVETDASVCFRFPPEQYPAPRFYEGPIRFRKHYYEGLAAMNGEEAACASILDNLPSVRYWVRNLERDTYAFWLQTTTDKFYPDFVALGIDGRVLAVEYKGGHLLETPDSIEKQRIGELWEARSNGRCLFRMVGQKDMMAKLSAVAGS